MNLRTPNSCTRRHCRQPISSIEMHVSLSDFWKKISLLAIETIRGEEIHDVGIRRVKGGFMWRQNMWNTYQWFTITAIVAISSGPANQKYQLASVNLKLADLSPKFVFLRSRIFLFWRFQGSNFWRFQGSNRTVWPNVLRTWVSNMPCRISKIRHLRSGWFYSLSGMLGFAQRLVFS